MNATNYTTKKKKFILSTRHLNAEVYKSKPDEFIQNTINSIPVKRLGKPKEIASTIEFLINNEYVNGSTLKLTGGL